MDVSYILNVDTNTLCMYYGPPGLRGVFVLPNSCFTAAIRLMKIHGVTDFSILYSNAESAAEAARLSSVAARMLNVASVHIINGVPPM